MDKQLKRASKPSSVINEKEDTIKGVKFGKRSRSPYESNKDAMFEEIQTIVNLICKELRVENYEDSIKKIREMKDVMKKTKKQRKLILNLQ